MSETEASDFVIRKGQAEQTSADMVIVLRSERLSGHFSIMEGEVRPGELLGFHTHANEDQHMYIINGELHFEVGGAGGLRFTAGAGDHVFKPRGSSHGFWNLGDETVRYVETSTESGFEHFVDGRADGLGAMLGAATSELGMSFELERSLEVMKEFQLSGLAGANVSDPKELLADPSFRALLRENQTVRELVVYLGGAKVRDFLKKL
ncbi:MAG: cupin domain-containing protein [Alphaproteobacteria bacterium]|nr:cupin domain-containing protein [Alphaproteobacteria bacterium]MCB9792392.1 cupin domain-containing protein [Alphaproteobacteria bacterium]